jgi:hypothetical protein
MVGIVRAMPSMLSFNATMWINCLIVCLMLLAVANAQSNNGAKVSSGLDGLDEGYFDGSDEIEDI